ncbi:hypothetical protein GEMRC1_010709 [Eukaryota sp. GEM-RC1]
MSNNDMFTPLVTDDRSPYISDMGRLSSKCIYFQQSLLVLIGSHLVRSLWQSCHDNSQDNNRNLHCFLKKIRTLQIGHVSQRFFESVPFAVTVFLEST